MNARSLAIYISCLFFFVWFSSSAQVIRYMPENAWEFHESGEQLWYKAEVPGTIHTDMYANGLIPNPYFGANEKDLQWIEQRDWEYRLSFDVPDSIWSQVNFELVCEGLDTYATVYLNDSLILKTENMFRTYRINCRTILQRQNNILRVVFESAVNRGKQLAADIPYTLPGDERIFTRKAQYQYGWDWGPRFVTCGIWRPIYFEAWNGIRVENILISTISFDNKRAEMLAEADIWSEIKTNAELTLLWDDAGISREFFSEKSALKPGNNKIKIKFIINDPQLWWCNGKNSNKTFLYNSTLVVVEKKGYRQLLNFVFGVRTIELIREHDSIGESFYFSLNHEPIFIKGANYIPPDNFLPGMDSAAYLSLIKDAVACNINMLRVWGGGAYENDYFYYLCDQYGILVWQDFMFACAMYPGDSGFIENIEKEAEDNVKRIGQHPCLALWCGNNEIEEGWENWGWQKAYKYSVADSEAIRNDYQNLFYELLPDVVNAYTPSINYIPTSPAIGWGHEESMQEGDSHYWGVWWGMEAFDVFETKIPRFMSEYGFQSLPDIRTINDFTDDTARYLYSEALKSHQKHPVGYETILQYMEREFPIPDKLEDFIYVSQLLQAGGITKAIEAQRRAMPRCMGTLYWQFNDCWPVVSWSGRDYFGRWKAMQYSVRRAYNEMFISAKVDSASLIIWAKDTDNSYGENRLLLKIIDFSGTLLWQKIVNIAPTGNLIVPLFTFSLRDIFTDDSIKKRCFLHAELLKENSQNIEQFEYVFLFAPPKELILPEVDFEVDMDSVGPGEWIIYLRADNFAKSVCLDFPDEDVFFEDNYFDLLPDKEKRIFLKVSQGYVPKKEKLRIKSLNEILDKYESR